MIYATGDTHGHFQRFAPEHFPEQAGMTKEDYMIICGDFGGVWDGGKKEERNLDWLEDLPFTTLFISGNHEIIKIHFICIYICMEIFNEIHCICTITRHIKSG